MLVSRIVDQTIHDRTGLQTAGRIRPKAPGPREAQKEGTRSKHPINTLKILKTMNDESQIHNKMRKERFFEIYNKILDPDPNISSSQHTPVFTLLRSTVPTPIVP